MKILSDRVLNFASNMVHYYIIVRYFVYYNVFKTKTAHINRAVTHLQLIFII